MPIHDEIRQALAAGLHEDNLLRVTGRIAEVRLADGSPRPAVLFTISSVLEAVWRRWFQENPIEVEFAGAITSRIVPSVVAVLAADERGDASELLSALDLLSASYWLCVERFPA